MGLLTLIAALSATPLAASPDQARAPSAEVAQVAQPGPAQTAASPEAQGAPARTPLTPSAGGGDSNAARAGDEGPPPRPLWSRRGEAPRVYETAWYVNGIVAGAFGGTFTGILAGSALQAASAGSSSAASNWVGGLALAGALVGGIGGHFLGGLAARGSTLAQIGVVALYLAEVTLVAGWMVSALSQPAAPAGRDFSWSR